MACGENAAGIHGIDNLRVMHGHETRNGHAASIRPVRVGAIDDHPITRRGIESLFAGARDVVVVATAESLDKLRESPAVGSDLSGLDVLLLDLYLGTDYLAPAGPSFDAIKELSAQVPVLVMSASQHRRDVLDAIRAGSLGYLTKDADADQFTRAVATVAGGGFYLSSALADLIGADLGGQGPEPELSPREEEALGWIARGFTHAQTASRMGVTKATVDTYVMRIRRKLQVGNKAELTIAAIRRHGHSRPDT